MDDNIVIKVRNLTKRYKLYSKPINRLKESLHPFRKKYHTNFKALDDISFDVKKGETVGIIGKNGSGKSTLLKVLTGVLTPSAGTVEVKGRVSALLELGSGFNPDFTGLENIYFNGAIMGYSREEIDERLDEILRFADIGDFINQPVKLYSSGMYVRLAFSLAINVDPDILIVDEALAVGDVFFQTKCILKIKQMMDKGITTLFVSHNPETIQSLCTWGILLDSGKIKMIGDPKTVSLEYVNEQRTSRNESLKTINVQEDLKADFNNINVDELPQESFLEGGEQFEKQLALHFGDDKGWIKNVKVLDTNGNYINSIAYKTNFIVRIYLEAKDDLDNYSIGIRIMDDKAFSVGGTTNTFEKIKLPELKKGEKKIYDFYVKNIYASGTYSISVGIEKVVILNEYHLSIDGMNGAAIITIMPPDDSADLFLTKIHTPMDIKVYSIK